MSFKESVEYTGTVYVGFQKCNTHHQCLIGIFKTWQEVQTAISTVPLASYKKEKNIKVAFHVMPLLLGYYEMEYTKEKIERSSTGDKGCSTKTQAQ
eukprot:15054747-Ditylum_brightwellii.AAC.1